MLRFWRDKQSSESPKRGAFLILLGALGPRGEQVARPAPRGGSKKESTQPQATTQRDPLGAERSGSASAASHSRLVTRSLKENTW